MSEMTMYEEYRESGVEWLGAVPSHWTLPSLGRYVTIRNGSDYKHVELAEGGYPVIGSGGIFRRASEYMFDGESVLFGRKGTIDKPLYVEGRFWTVDTMFYTEIQKHNLLPKFLYYFALHIPYGYFVTSTALPSMTQSEISAIKIALPPLSEQRAIASFLDRETKEIDEFIADQEELIALLNERRAATITQAVTKGLDPNAPMKDSGVEWLGKVPAGWDATPFLRVIESRVDYRGATPRKTDAGIVLVTAKNVRQGYIDYESSMEFIDPQDYLNVMSRGLPKVGDILMTMEAPLGNVALVDDATVAFAQRIIKFRASDILLPKFALYAMGSEYFQDQMQSRATGSTALGLKASKLHQLRIVVPSLDEQKMVCRYLDREIAEIDAAISDAKESIGLSKERRAALISAAVTGKIDVRDHAAVEEAAK